MIPSLRETASAQALQHRFCHHPQCAIELNVGSHENVPPDVVKPAGVVMKTARHLHRHNNRGET